MLINNLACHVLFTPFHISLAYSLHASSYMSTNNQSLVQDGVQR